jgi:hypothetical protein
MANVCTNEVFITTNDVSNYSYLLKKLEYELVSDVYHTTEEDIEATFESKWDFPLHNVVNHQIYLMIYINKLLIKLKIKKKV